jgi:hypothetical protein
MQKVTLNNKVEELKNNIKIIESRKLRNHKEETLFE